MTTAQMTESRLLAVKAAFRKIVNRLFNYALLIFLAFFVLFPIVFMIVAAFKPHERAIADLDSIQALLPNPRVLTLNSIKDVFDRVPFEHLFLNSLLITVLAVTVGLFVNSMIAFALARINWFGRSLVLGIVVSLIIIPLEAIAVPLMLQMNQMSDAINVVICLVLGVLLLLLWTALWNVTEHIFWKVSFALRRLLQIMAILLLAAPLELLSYFVVRQTLDGGTWLNSYQVQILPFIAEPFAIFLFYQFFIGLPKEFDEAAYVDGAGYFRIYWQIIVPLSRPVFATIAILRFLQFWGFYTWPLMTTRGADYQPLMVGMDYFQTQAPIQWGSIMAYATMVTIPVLIVFLLFQRWFIASVSSSGVKG
ncbi:MAG: carbohydrate ABC transporter permease [Anaerolineae bacterium]|nr:carbohydrate ABC transporter permease [Anaerolineae bacterium]